VHLAIAAFGALAVLLVLGGQYVAGVIPAAVAGVLVFAQRAKRGAREAITREIQRKPVETSSLASYTAQPEHFSPRTNRARARRNQAPIRHRGHRVR
jgi:hypothetical protein